MGSCGAWEHRIAQLLTVAYRSYGHALGMEAQRIPLAADERPRSMGVYLEAAVAGVNVTESKPLYVLEGTEFSQSSSVTSCLSRLSRL